METLGIGMLGTGWMAKAHTNALRRLQVIAEPPFQIQLVALGGRDPERTARTAQAWGFGRASTDWRDVVEDPRVDVLVNLTGNDAHAEPSIAAVDRGVHVLCEKPLATDPAQVRAMVNAAEQSTAVAACGYNYRFAPAVQVIRDLVKSGRLGGIRAASFGYEQDWAATDAARTGWRFADPVAGSAVYDLSHILDLLDWILGTPTDVVADVSTRTDEGVRPAVAGIDPEDAFTALARVQGLTVPIRASRIATGYKGHQFVEIVGSEGTVSWDMEDLNRLRLWLPGDDTTNGFRDVLVTELAHPFMDRWYAPGHIIGWEDTVLHQWLAFLNAITGFDPTLPTGLASFSDAARAVAFAGAIRASSHDGDWSELPQDAG